MGWQLLNVVFSFAFKYVADGTTNKHHDVSRCLFRTLLYHVPILVRRVQNHPCELTQVRRGPGKEYEGVLCCTEYEYTHCLPRSLLLWYANNRLKIHKLPALESTLLCFSTYFLQHTKHYQKMPFKELIKGRETA